MVPLKQVKSSMIKAAGYDPVSRVLAVHFNNGTAVHHFRDVPPEVADGLASAESAAASDAEIDKHLEAILRAAGSSLRHYSFGNSKNEMRAALRAALATLAEQPEPDTGHLSRAVAVGTNTARPRFITFTGADEHTSVDGMVALSRQYPIEWGILFSPRRQGEGRYPPMAFVRGLVKRDGLRLSAHLCGGHSRDVLTAGKTLLNLSGFERAQVNSAEPNIDVMSINRWARSVGVEPILQCRSSFPSSTQVGWLYDKSGGKGIAPMSWPAPHPAMTSGYAGGINPDNVLDVIATINATDYWIDMECGVRDEQDRFSLDKCRQVCEAVYGEFVSTDKTIGTDVHCAWKEDEDGLWQMSCGGDPWVFEDGGVVENRVKFCMNCGKEVSHE